jgi:hypothetical protein
VKADERVGTEPIVADGRVYIAGSAVFAFGLPSK